MAYRMTRARLSGLMVEHRGDRASIARTLDCSIRSVHLWAREFGMGRHGVRGRRRITA
jgi:hypothetical protein